MFWVKKCLWIEHMCDIIIHYKKAVKGGDGMGLHDGHRQRKREQFLRHGLEGFTDHEVLELLLFYAIPRQDTNETAHSLLKKFGSLQGVGENAAAFLSLLPAAMRRVSLSGGEETILTSVNAAGAYFSRLLCGERREVLYLVCLDSKGKVLGCNRLSSGTVSAAPVSVREVVEVALRCDASRVLLGHNHPSGVALPSDEDRQITLQIRQALATMDIVLVDHIVVADGDFVSMAASGMIL